MQVSAKTRASGFEHREIFVDADQPRGGAHIQAAGGETLHLVEGLNTRPRWIEAMAAIALEQLEGWT